MKIKEKISENIDKLPENFQSEVLDFVEYLLSKSTGNMILEQNNDWSNFSLASAMRGMEDEKTPDYSEEDIKVKFT
ncbi:DUF2281 domain-containing protein [bacterium]|nr:DUF2281 domain-containing protein [bacterium]